MVARTKKIDTAAPDANPEPALVRKPRVPKPVNDVATATAAFNRAKKTADKAEAALEAAHKNAHEAYEVLGEAAKVLKGYLADVDAAVNATLPVDNDTDDDHGAYAAPEDDGYDADGVHDDQR